MPNKPNGGLIVTHSRIKFHDISQKYADSFWILYQEIPGNKIFCAVCANVSVVVIEVTSMYYYMSLKYLLTCSEVRVI